MLILGIDIGNGLATCYLRDSNAPRQYNIELDGLQYYAFKANAQGISQIIALNPDCVILEPTGTNYSRLWGTHLARAGVEVRLVSHQALKAHRQVLQIPDKDDQLDAYALADYGLQYYDQPLRFLQVRGDTIPRIRELVLRLGHLNRVQSPIINRLRQDLAWQFPEASKIRSLRQNLTPNPPLLWRWLAGEAKSKRYDSLYSNSCGLGLTDTVILHAARLVNLQHEEYQIELELKQLIDNPLFIPYRKVFTRFGFGLRFQALLLSQIYPITAYLGDDGKPIILHRKGRKSGKITKRPISQRRFLKAVGLAPVESSSGDYSSKVVGGSDLCRVAWWQWVFTKIEPLNARKNNPICLQVYDYFSSDTRKGKPIKQLRISTAAYASRLLFKALVEEITN